MSSSDGKPNHSLVSAAFSAIFSACVFFIVFLFFNVDKEMSYADFDAGALGIVASSFIAIGLSALVFQKKKRLLFYSSASILLLLIWFFFLYAIKESIRLDRYDAEFNWLFLSFAPCTIVFGKGLKEKWFRASSSER